MNTKPVFELGYETSAQPVDSSAMLCINLRWAPNGTKATQEVDF